MRRAHRSLDLVAGALVTMAIGLVVALSPGHGAAQDRDVDAGLEPDAPAGVVPPPHELPDQDLSDQDLPSGELPDQDLSDQDLPSGELSDRGLPDQDLPGGDPPSGELSDQDLPSEALPEGSDL